MWAGPVVRIGPDEVQLSDPENYDQIYTVGSKFYKEPRIYGTLGSEMLFTAISNETHRQMRAPLNHFFSRRAVLDLEDIVQAKAKKLCDWVARDLAVETRPGGERASVNLRAGTRAMAIDVLTEYAFNDCWNHLDKPDFASWWSDAVRGTGIMWMTFQQFPALVKPMQALPESLSRKMSPAMDGWIDCVVRSRTHLYQVCDQFRKGIKPSRRSIFHELLDPPAPDPKDVAAGLANANPPAPPSRERLEGEALALTTAGSDSTGNVMETAVFHVIRQPGLYAAVRKELLDAFPNLPPDTDQNLDYATLEKLPLLSAVLKEGLRLSYGVTGRLARVVPKGGATFNGFYIPEGVSLHFS